MPQDQWGNTLHHAWHEILKGNVGAFSFFWSVTSCVFSLRVQHFNALGRNMNLIICNWILQKKHKKRGEYLRNLTSGNTILPFFGFNGGNSVKNSVYEGGWMP